MSEIDFFGNLPNTEDVYACLENLVEGLTEEEYREFFGFEESLKSLWDFGGGSKAGVQGELAQIIKKYDASKAKLDELERTRGVLTAEERDFGNKLQHVVSRFKEKQLAINKLYDDTPSLKFFLIWMLVWLLILNYVGFLQSFGPFQYMGTRLQLPGNPEAFQYSPKFLELTAEYLKPSLGTLPRCPSPSRLVPCESRDTLKRWLNNYMPYERDENGKYLHSELDTYFFRHELFYEPYKSNKVACLLRNVWAYIQLAIVKKLWAAFCKNMLDFFIQATTGTSGLGKYIYAVLSGGSLIGVVFREQIYKRLGYHLEQESFKYLFKIVLFIGKTGVRYLILTPFEYFEIDPFGCFQTDEKRALLAFQQEFKSADRDFQKENQLVLALNRLPTAPLPEPVRLEDVPTQTGQSLNSSFVSVPAVPVPRRAGSRNRIFTEPIDLAGGALCTFTKGNWLLLCARMLLVVAFVIVFFNVAGMVDPMKMASFAAKLDFFIHEIFTKVDEGYLIRNDMIRILTNEYAKPFVEWRYFLHLSTSCKPGDESCRVLVQSIIEALASKRTYLSNAATYAIPCVLLGASILIKNNAALFFRVVVDCLGRKETEKLIKGRD